MLDTSFLAPQWLDDKLDVISVSTKSIAGQPVIEVNRKDGATTLHDPVNGLILSPLDEVRARQIAHRAWTGSSTAITRASLIGGPIGTEFAGPFPAWQMQFADEDGTRLYVDASNGNVLAARSDTWRLFDFIWGLHIMDWTQRDRINSWWLLVFGIGGTLIALSGFVLLANRFPKLKRKKSGVSVSRIVQP